MNMSGQGSTYLNMKLASASLAVCQESKINLRIFDILLHKMVTYLHLLYHINSKGLRTFDCFVTDRPEWQTKTG